MQLSALYVQASLHRREQQRIKSRNNPSICYSASTTHHQDSREMPAVSRSLEKDCRSLAHQGPDPRNTSRLDQRSTSVHKTIRFSKKLDRQAHRPGGLQKDPPTLSRHRINPSTPRPVRNGRSVVSLLPSSERRAPTRREVASISTRSTRTSSTSISRWEGLHTIQAQLRRRDHMWKIDMSDFYMHLLIARGTAWSSCFCSTKSNTNVRQSPSG